MNRIAKMLLAVVLPVAGILPAVAAHTHVPTPSTWTLNLKESDFGGGPGYKSDVYVLNKDTDQWMSYTDMSVDDKGNKMTLTLDAPADGSMHPVKGLAGAMASWNAATDTSTGTNPDGSSYVQTYVVSGGGKKATFKQELKMKDGKVYHQTLVYYRTK